jgi:hypothetical protein
MYALSLPTAQMPHIQGIVTDAKLKSCVSAVGRLYKPSTSKKAVVSLVEQRHRLRSENCPHVFAGERVSAWLDPTISELSIL